jgi:carboxyl-terminal processing protease
MKQRRTVTLILAVAAYFVVATPWLQRSHGQLKPHLRNGNAICDVTAESDSSRIAYYAKTLDEIYATVQRYFWDRKLNGVDWDRIHASYAGQLNHLKNNMEFRALVNRMLGELHASHMDYETTADFEYYMLSAVKDQNMEGNRIAQIGITGHGEKDGYHVQAALNDSPAAAAGIQGGDILVAADGEPFLSAASLSDREGQRIVIDVKGNNGAMRRVTVVPVKKNALRAFLDATRQSATILNISGRHIGYIHLWTMANDSFRRTMDALVLGNLHNTDGLILDLRDGYGGNPFGFSDVFLRPDISWEMQGHAGQSTITYTGYGKPMVVLINGGTRSAKEFLTYQFKAAHRATIIGTRTAGAFLGAVFFPIGNNGILELAGEGLLVNGAPLENRGVEPDITVAPDQTYTAHDAQLLRAEQILSKAPLTPDHGPAREGVIRAN